MGRAPVAAPASSEQPWGHVHATSQAAKALPSTPGVAPATAGYFDNATPTPAEARAGGPPLRTQWGGTSAGPVRNGTVASGVQPGHEAQRAALPASYSAPPAHAPLPPVEQPAAPVSPVRPSEPRPSAWYSPGGTAVPAGYPAPESWPVERRPARHHQAGYTSASPPPMQAPAQARSAAAYGARSRTRTHGGYLSLIHI